MQGKDANCSRKDMLITASAREIADRELVYVGIGLPKLAAFLAKKTHAQRAILCIEAGVIGINSFGKPMSLGDPKVASGCTKSCGIFYTLSLLQKGVVDLCFLGGAEVDKFGNINSTVIGDYKKPKIRFPGSGGASDFASNAKRTVIMMPHEKRRFPEKVSYITSPGFIDGPEGRKKAGLKWGGPSRVITDLAVLGFHPETKAMQLESIHPGVSISEVLDNTGFDLLIPSKVPFTKRPTAKQLSILRNAGSI
jgi:acyl CoA:acetate/3-ketoacid CoA transferase beta subunit